MTSNLIRPRNIAAVVIALMGGAVVYELYRDNQRKKEHDDQVKMNLAPTSLSQTLLRLGDRSRVYLSEDVPVRRIFVWRMMM